MTFAQFAQLMHNEFESSKKEGKNDLKFLCREGHLRGVEGCAITDVKIELDELLLELYAHVGKLGTVLKLKLGGGSIDGAGADVANIVMMILVRAGEGGKEKEKEDYHFSDSI